MDQFSPGSSGAGGGSPAGAGGGGPSGSGGIGSLGGSPIDPGSGGCSPQTFEPRLGERRADVVLAVDTASTPNPALEMVELALNPFADAMARNAIELRLAVLAEHQALCVPAPLGSGACEPQGADSRFPNVFHHATAVIDDGDALEVILGAYPMYAQSLDLLADTTLIVVSGGDARAPFNTPTSFEQAFTTSRLPNVLPWRMSAFYGFSSCEGIRAEGRVYREIVESTGGVHADLCTESGAAAFGRIADSIIDAVLPCTFLIPEPTPDRPIDPRTINVLLRASGGDRVVPFVEFADGCNGPLGGWHYDDPLSTRAIVTCPVSCARMRAEPDSEFVVALGCPTIGGPTGE